MQTTLKHCDGKFSKNQKCKCNNLVFTAVFKMLFSLIITVHPGQTISLMLVSLSLSLCVCVCVRTRRQEGPREICLLAQLSHQTDLPQSVHPLLCQSTRLSLSGKRQPIAQPLTLRVTTVAMATAGPSGSKVGRKQRTMWQTLQRCYIPQRQCASRLTGSYGIKKQVGNFPKKTPVG